MITIQRLGTVGVAGAVAVLALQAGAVNAAPRGGPAPSGLVQSSLAASDNHPGDSLGDAVAASGNTAVAGAYLRTVSGKTDAGAVDVFERPTTGWSTTKQVATLTAPTALTEGYFGYSVAVSGKTIVVGAVGQDADKGAVYVFTEPTGGWRSTSHPSATLTASDGGVHYDFGNSVAISGSTIVVGSSLYGSGFNGAAYVFSEPANGWKSGTETAELSPNSGTDAFDRFGGSVAVSGNTVVVGALGRYSNTGRAYVYVKPTNGPWKDTTENTQLVGSAVTNTYFGVSVAIQGNTVVVGEDDATINKAAKAGHVYVFTKPAAGWGQVASPPVPPAPTAVLTADDGAASDELGSSVAILGNVIAAGAPGKANGATEGVGAVYLFTPQAAGWVSETETSEVTPNDGQSADRFGQTIGLGTGDVVAGSEAHNQSAGAAYVFALPRPVLTDFSQAHKSWVLGSAKPVVNPSKPRHGGTSFGFRLNQAATVTLQFAEKIHGKTVDKGKLKFAAKAGVNRVYVDGRIASGKKLVAGHVTVTIAATNTRGTTTPRSLHFTVRA